MSTTEQPHAEEEHGADRDGEHQGDRAIGIHGWEREDAATAGRVERGRGRLRRPPPELVAAWWPVMAWIVLIVWLSGDRFADSSTAAWFSRPWLATALGLSPAELETVNVIVRKCAHFVEYAVLGALGWRGARRTWPTARGGKWLAVAVAVAAATAAVDELGQGLMAAQRSGKASDAVLDVAGGAAGALAAAWLSSRRCRRAP